MNTINSNIGLVAASIASKQQVTSSQAAWRSEMLSQILNEVRKHEPQIAAAQPAAPAAKPAAAAPGLNKGRLVNCYA